tara:strand:- start:536 stop:736 length:201 start_codon:yes stop_codon:yes gene_type:complete
MTAKEKAEELVRKYDETLTYLESKSKAKQCAIIAVDEIITSHHNLYGVNNKEVKFYLEVKKEIENL